MASSAGNAGSGKKPIKILHVEDERGALEVTKFFLERKGQNDFEVHQALSAEQALEKLENGDFDIVISDYKMPGMNGLEFLDELRKRGNDIPFIIFTGKGEERVAIEALNRGANRYIKKEGSPDVLFDNLARHIRELVMKRTEQKRAEGEGEYGGGETYYSLVQALNDPDWNVRVHAANSLGELGDVRAVEPLIARLEDEDEDVRTAAARALGMIGDTGARTIDALISSLKDEKRGVRKAAAHALGMIGKPALERLIQALSDRSAHVRLGAAEALGMIRDASAIEPLIHALSDDNLDVRWSAAEALHNIGEPAVEPLLKTLRNIGDRDVKWSIVEILGGIRDRRAVEPLIHALSDDAENVRMSAAWALGRIGDPEAVLPLFQALKDRNGNVRKAAAEALAMIGVPAIDVLIRGLREKDAHLRKTCAEILSEIRDVRAAEALFQARMDDDQEVRRAALRALDKIQRDAARVKGGRGGIRMRISDTRMHGVNERDEVKLTPEQLKEIKDLHARGYRDLHIAEKMGIPVKSVEDYLRGERVRRLEEKYMNVRRFTV